jgi:F1F0 ATPase subunit 2
MREMMILAPALVAGFLLGLIFFGGLLWTVLRGRSSKYPALWFLLSLILRTGIVVTGFYFIAGVFWERWLSCLVGFVFARIVVLRITRDQPFQTEGARHANEF